MIETEIYGSMIGVLGVGVAYLGKIGICWLKLKLNKAPKGARRSVCGQHNDLLVMVREIKNHYDDEKQVELYSRAIKRATGQE